MKFHQHWWSKGTQYMFEMSLLTMGLTVVIYEHVLTLKG